MMIDTEMNNQGKNKLRKLKSFVYTKDENRINIKSWLIKKKDEPKKSNNISSYSTSNTTNSQNSGFITSLQFINYVIHNKDHLIFYKFMLILLIFMIFITVIILIIFNLINNITQSINKVADNTSLVFKWFTINNLLGNYNTSNITNWVAQKMISWFF